jgi:hypothetical protein
MKRLNCRSQMERLVSIWSFIWSDAPVALRYSVRTEHSVMSNLSHPQGTPGW